MRFLNVVVMTWFLGTMGGCKDNDPIREEEIGDLGSGGGHKNTKRIVGVSHDVTLPSGKIVKVQGSIFSGGKKPGDFGWMIEQPAYSKTLFVYNDNQEQFLAFVNNDKTSGCSVGGGNAIIRPFQCMNPPRALGVPTGHHGTGYSSLTPYVKDLIDDSIKRIRETVIAHGYETVLFSQNNRKQTLGSGIFKVGEDVRDYIFKSLLRLEPIN